MDTNLEKATFAGGCFWCMVKPFDKWNGVKSVISGYSGGEIENPTYEQVKSGTTGHYEVVQITYDPDIISYPTILNIYWQQIDPTDAEGQFHDRGSSYRTAIFYHSEKQKQIALKSKEDLNKSGRFSKPVVTPILPAAPFYAAEDYHQDFYKKNPEEYEEDRAKSGRDQFISEHWGKKSVSAK
ncbi:peptide-methionine (S)-S-oxide reductase MsrA [Caldibacillus lycopersici]|uniref:Peptide methionine sulfoxide reductase MsrA n=1 Tax=Perspicuibacillus lycopersici TaxID=1325689 RepID=A0AAE3IVC7_9BACI|nr:peptide-methionine (S)-S-oxide reductase MsrA [Perspicuibacillus lycopersici]MCU9613574.1 peptide-methionine (S)-S-oxide reductase MsrA [Perspicuibacillus lycopersici]